MEKEKQVRQCGFWRYAYCDGDCENCPENKFTTTNHTDLDINSLYINTTCGSK